MVSCTLFILILSMYDEKKYITILMKAICSFNYENPYYWIALFLISSCVHTNAMQHSG